MQEAESFPGQKSTRIVHGLTPKYRSVPFWKEQSLNPPPVSEEDRARPDFVSGDCRSVVPQTAKIKPGFIAAVLLYQGTTSPCGKRPNLNPAEGQVHPIARSGILSRPRIHTNRSRTHSKVPPRPVLEQSLNPTSRKRRCSGPSRFCVRHGRSVVPQTAKIKPAL